jgi:hypothetical protein
MRNQSALFGLVLIALCARPAPAQLPSFGPSCQLESFDDDGDALSTSCELEIARQVAPVLIVPRGGCNWDAVQSRLAGGYFTAVQPVGDTVRVAFLPAYFEDCGWSGIKCWLPKVDCTPHHGDSEFIVVDVTRAADRTLIISGIFLSAHCFGKYDNACHWYRGAELASFAFRGSHPVIWVAEGRNANYRSAGECDRGLHSIDTCDRNDVAVMFPIASERNIGSRAQPFAEGGCIAGSALRNPLVDAQTTECFWQPGDTFGGWQPAAPGVTPYSRYLNEVARF